MADCIFCKIVKGDIPSFTLYESPSVLAFLDAGPLSAGHALVIPKFHGEKLTDIPDESLAEILPVAKRVAKATGAEHWNLLQNNGRWAHQEVGHVHFHVIPKPKADDTEGLGVKWPAVNMLETAEKREQLRVLMEEIKAKM